MAVYEYLCDDCGPFTAMRPMAECDLPLDCPACARDAPRVSSRRKKFELAMVTAALTLTVQLSG